MNRATIDHSLSKVYVYKVPSKILDKTKKLLEDASLTVYTVSTDDAVPTVSYVAKLPEFSDLTDYTSATYIENAAGILRKVLAIYYEFYGWRINTSDVVRRVNTITSDLSTSYTGAGESLVKTICSNKAVLSKVTSSISNYSGPEINLAVDPQIMKDLEQSVKELTLKNLKGPHQLDWMDNTTSFLDNKVYTSHTVRLFFSQLGFSI